jgi:hypothetical protein
MLYMVPLPRSVSLRGGGKTTPFSRHIVPELCLRPRTNRFAPGNQRGKRSAERRIQPMPRPAPRARRAPQTSVRSLRNSPASGARSPSGAPHAALAGALTSRLSSGPCFLNSAHSGRYPLACKPSAGTAPPAAAVVPQGVMPEAAGERFARPFPAVRLRLHHQRLGTSANRHFVGHFVDSVHVLPPLPRSSFAMAASAILSVRAK